MSYQKKKQPKSAANALVVAAHVQGTEIALPADLMSAAKGFAKHSRSESTRRKYAMWWKDFSDWCHANGRDPMPASIDTVIGYVTGLATRSGRNCRGADTGRPLAISSIDQAMAAIKLAHHAQKFAFDSTNEGLMSVLKGIRREVAKTRTIRQVRPFLFSDLRELLEMLRPDVLREARDAALIALACAGALRRSELVGLDWAVLGTSEDKYRKGFLMIDDDGMTIRLMTSKASQDAAQDVPVPRDFAMLICKAVEHWIKVGAVECGTPLFRSTQGGSSQRPQSGYVGVSWAEKTKKWRATYRSKNWGEFATQAEAHAAYCKAKGVPVGHFDGRVKMNYKRLTAEIVADVVKKRMKQLIEARNNKRGAKKLSKQEMDALVAMYSGHSPRSGYATSAAMQEVPIHRIQQQTRHKSVDMVAKYIREVDMRKNSGLKGVGF